MQQKCIFLQEQKTKRRQLTTLGGLCWTEPVLNIQKQDPLDYCLELKMFHRTSDRHQSFWAVGDFPSLDLCWWSCWPHHVLQVVNGTKLSESCQDKDVCRQGMWQLPLPLLSKGCSSLMHAVSSVFLLNYYVYVMMLGAVFAVLWVCKLLTPDPRGSTPLCCSLHLGAVYWPWYISWRTFLYT